MHNIQPKICMLLVHWSYLLISFEVFQLSTLIINHDKFSSEQINSFTRKIYYIEHAAEKSNRMPNHGLYGSTSCCIIHGPSQWQTAIYISETPRPIFMKLEIYNYFSNTIPHAKFQGPTSTWVVWANSQFDAWKFLSFFSLLWHAQWSHFWTHPNAQYVIIRGFRQGSAFWGLEKLNLKFDPLYAQKT